MDDVESGHTTLLTIGKVPSLMKSKSKRQGKFKETLVSKKWSNSGRKMKKKKKQRQKGDG